MNDGKITIEFKKDEIMNTEVEDVNGLQLMIAIMSLIKQLTEEIGIPLESMLATIKATIEAQS